MLYISLRMEKCHCSGVAQNPPKIINEINKKKKSLLILSIEFWYDY